MKAAPAQYVPEWHGAIEGYTVNQVTRALWRVAITHDREDLMQEARIVFLKCQRAYPVIDTPQHFMALYKTALTNRIADLSNKHTRIASVSVGDDPDISTRREQAGALDNDGCLSSLIRQAPREVSMVLALFLNAPTELLEVAEQSWMRSKHGKRDLNAMVKRLLGPGVGEEPIKQVEAYFNRD